MASGRRTKGVGVYALSEVFRPDRCARGPDHHVHPAPVVVASALFLAALITYGAGLTPVLLLGATAVSYAFGLRHAPPSGG